jgi:predicted NBD/HSP70 family sugar kinase
MNRKYIAFDIGGTFVKSGVIDGDGKMIDKTKEKTPNHLEELLALIEQRALEHEDVEGIAISTPGAVSPEGVIYGSSAIPYIHGPNMKELVQRRVKKPVFLENDANCAGLAEMWRGAGVGKKDVLVMVIGTGIGGAVFKNGHLHKGCHLHGGEFGYMLLTTDIKGDNDVWSRIASTKALVRTVARLKNIDENAIDGEEIFRLAKKGDEVCLQALDRFYHYLAVGIYNLQYIYDPEIILIGGGISANNELIPRINEKLEQILSVIHLAKMKPQIAPCHFRQDANLLGAVYGFIREYSNIGST